MKTPLVILTLAALAFAGREFAYASPGIEHGTSLRASATSATISALGGLRAFPLMALWSELDEAKRIGDWSRQLFLFDAIEQFCPNNSAMVSWHGFTEAVSVSADQANREQALDWLNRGLQRLSLGAGRIPDSALPHEACWNVGFYAGRQFPCEYARAVFKTDPARLAQLEDINARLGPALRAYFERIDLKATGAGDELDNAQRELMREVERMRCRAMDAVATRMLACQRHRSATQCIRALLSVYMLATLTESGTQAQLGRDDIREELRLRALAIIDDEAARLQSRGEHDSAASFKRVAQGYLDDWPKDGE